MPTQKDAELADKVREATDDGRIGWEPTAISDEFIASFQGKYKLKSFSEGGNVYLEMRDAEDRLMMQLTDADHYQLRFLHEAARRSALNVDKAIDDIIQEISN